LKTVIWWIRRDLRLSDNPALTEALRQGDVVIPLFILDGRLLASPYVGQARLAFLYSGLHVLEADLRARGSGLILRRGDPLEVLGLLKEETGAEAIFAERDFSPFARRRDKTVADALPLRLLDGLTVHPPEKLLKADGKPYTVFTPFSRFWRNLPFPGRPLPAPDYLSALPPLESLPIPNLPFSSAELTFPAGEAQARKRLESFLGTAIQTYSNNRNRMDLEGTSGLSPYLRFGMLSARQAAWAALQAEDWAWNSLERQGVETWLNELIWREFYISILYHFPKVRCSAFRQELRRIPWRNDPEDFAAWQEGRTGYPVVDAAMRQMNATGWMHNRARMIAASFLVKDLLIDWRWGERYFMQNLLDGDPASNNGGWQWTAGTGTDAAPYFRVFNPVLQGRKFDPEGAYVRRWVPELAAVPEKYIHAPWEMPANMQQALGCRMGVDYPLPIVDHRTAREWVLAAYRQSRS
jgi:deoxyribodipyrimidine photo-lyase